MTATAVPDQRTERVPLRSWLAVTAVTLGTFLVVTVENLPMGLLTAIGAGLHVTDGQVGFMVTVSGPSPPSPPRSSPWRSRTSTEGWSCSA